MEHSIALVTGTTLRARCYAATRLLAAQGYREVIVTGRSLARIKETAAQLAVETHARRSSRRCSWIWMPRPAFSPPSRTWSSEACLSISYCSTPEWSVVKSA